ncbi:MULTISPECIES: LysR family transcriptional regulator [unclassified Ensifer]|uniref:LysR family transcriptional regulator n=1 Tax=unclassified Ensifer TaxID=2633371 RepID=UPI0008134512|nr:MULTISPECIES: LysR family transcriptional regulator [unclassified Ensifer]OCP04241.1 transcriptional regulator [Ensifer sp. LC11]OCP04501.1 transcriptional regulator [Ensifer sp. LC13]OCP08908.1 transcriptional regulator [Ensifer sp. LC14]OCP30478.1 transcriptional regulator [Ensifer sp. LC499]
MSRIEDLETFLAIVEQGSLTGAAKRLGRPLQTVSRSLATLETDIGVELVHRTTRRSVPSEAGGSFYQRIKPAVEEIKEAREEAAQRRSEPSGVLRLGAPNLFAPRFLMPVVAEYMRRYPQVEVDLDLSDAFVDLTASGLDMVIRIGDLADSGLTGKRLGALRRVVFGAPSYFARCGRPSHPLELAEHSCVTRTVDERPGGWMFTIDGRARAVKVRGAFRTNSMNAIYAAVEQGLGLGYSPLWQIKHLIDAGRVETILEPFEPAPVPIHALWLEGRSPNAKIRCFLDLLGERLKLDRL